MFELEIPVRITKELLLSKYTQETYFEHYLGVPVKKGIFCSPSVIRVDKNPTCSFYKNSRGVIKYKDFAGPTFDFVGCVMYIYTCTYYKALKIIANDFNIIQSDNLEKHPPLIKYTGAELSYTEKANIQVEIQDYSEKELSWWGAFGISLNTLKKYKVFSIKSIFLNGNYFSSSTDTCPIYGYFGGFDTKKDELWRLYMPTKKKYRFLSNWSSLVLQGVRMLPKENDYLLVTKSLKDVMTAYEYGIVAVAPNSENIILSNAQFQKLKINYKNIFCLFDNDLAGVKGAHKYKKAFSCKCIFIKRKYSKDLSDLHKKVSLTQFWEIIDELNLIFSDPKINNTKHFYIF